MKINCITTQEDIITLFEKLNLSEGDNVFVHSSLSSLGYVVNGALDVIDSLVEKININFGTILMPAHSGQMADPESWQSPPIPKQFIDSVKTHMKPFDIKLTPVKGRGIITETFLKYPNVKRSSHPLNSVSALGKLASFFTCEHNFHEPEGEFSPVGKLYKIDGHVLLLGVGLSACTAIHLAEYFADVPYLYESKLKVLRYLDGEKFFTIIKKYPNGSEYFDKIFPDIKKKKLVKTVRYNNKDFYYFKIKPVVDFVVQRLKKDPYYLIMK